MPLVNGSSRAAVSENIRREMDEGKPQRQAIAIALDIARRARADGGRITAIDRAANKAAVPSEAQKESGNYRKGRIRLHGLDIAVENPRGSPRSGVDHDGKRWSVKMPDHYGYVKRTEGADGDPLDVYVGRDIHSDKVFVVDQVDAATKKFDEHKCMLGYRDRQTARRAYCAAFSDGKGPQRIGSMVEMTVPEFKEWIKQGDMTKPLARRYASGGEVERALQIARRASGGGLDDELPIVLPRRAIDLTPLPPQATEYKPTFRDRIARTLVGDAPPSPERRQFVSGLMGSTGIGPTGMGLVDMTPAGVPLAVNDAGKQGDVTQAALAVMPASRLASAGERAGIRAFHGSPHANQIRAYHSAYEPFDAFDFSRLGQTTAANTGGISGIEDWANNLARIGAWASETPVSAKVGAPYTLPVEISGKGRAFGSLDALEAAVRKAGGPEQFRQKMLEAGFGHLKVKDEEFGTNSFIGLAPNFFKILNDAGKAGDFQQAALAAMPAMLGGSGVAAASQGQQGNDGMKDGGAIDSSLRIARQYAGGGMTPWYTRAQARQMTHTGPLHSPIAGRTDHIPLNVPAGAYVLPADVVSGLGQGNTTAGMKVVDHMFSSGPYGMGLKGTRGRNSMPRAPRARGAFAEGGEVGDEPVEIVAAGGEYVLSPEEVAIVGNGDMELGHRILDAFVLKVRKDTVNTLKTLPPPAKD